MTDENEQVNRAKSSRRWILFAAPIAGLLIVVGTYVEVPFPGKSTHMTIKCTNGTESAAGAKWEMDDTSPFSQSPAVPVNMPLNGTLKITGWHKGTFTDQSGNQYPMHSVSSPTLGAADCGFV